MTAAKNGTSSDDPLEAPHTPALSKSAKLYRQIAASGIAPDHPWRMSLAEIVDDEARAAAQSEGPGAQSDAAVQTQYTGNFTCSTGETQIFIEQGSAQDYANTRASQLYSLLTLLSGEGGDVFRNYNVNIQDDVLWLASGLAHDLKETLKLIPGDARNGGAA